MGQCGGKSMPRVRFKPTIPVFKALHSLDHMIIVISVVLIVIAVED
jgi:hypothetical protein